MEFNEYINNHINKINQIDNQIKRLKENYNSTKNSFLSDEINNKILNHEIAQLENEIVLHKFCINCLKEKKYLDLVSDHKFLNARKKKLNKLLKKVGFAVVDVQE